MICSVNRRRDQTASLDERIANAYRNATFFAGCGEEAEYTRQPDAPVAELAQPGAIASRVSINYGGALNVKTKHIEKNVIRERS